jgi:DNA-binding CsgD family transcriptional regulator
MAELLHSIIQWAVRMLRVDAAEIFLYDPQDNVLTLAIASGFPESNIGTGLKPGEGLAGRVFESGKPMMVSDYSVWQGKAAAFPDGPPNCTELAVPMQWQGETVGVLTVEVDTRKRALAEDDIEPVSLCANLAAVAIENARLYQELHGSMNALRRTLEQEVAERTAELANRTARLRAPGLAGGATPAASLDELLGRVVELKIARKVLDQLSQIPSGGVPLASLTGRESEVLSLLAEGRTNKEIALLLTISLKTVKAHVSSILSKLGVTDRTQAALYGARLGLVSRASDQAM